MYIMSAVSTCNIIHDIYLAEQDLQKKFKKGSMSKLPKHLQIKSRSHEDVFFRTTETVFFNIPYIFLF